MKKTKALVLMSGGLDSMLAARTLMDQSIEVTGIVFVSNFFGAKKAHKAASQIGVELKEVEFKKNHLDMVRSPKHGYGKNMNPCIDCHAMMLRYAKEIMEEEGYDFVATGEVLGQRPMSQNREALATVSKESGLGGLLVRPMSAKLLEESLPEKEGKIIRGKLHSIKGRSRERQRELIKKYGIKEYASPGGGCLLTDPEFSQRLIKMFDIWPNCDGEDIELLKNGRIFWFNEKGNRKALVVIGRNQEESEGLEKLAQVGDTLIELKDIVGPTTLIRGLGKNFKGDKEIEIEIDIPKELKLSELNLSEGKIKGEILDIAAKLTGCYSPKARDKKVILNINYK